MCCVEVKCLLLLNHLKFVCKVQHTFKEHEEKIHNTLELKRKENMLEYTT